MTDDNLIAFAEWCRVNRPRVVFDRARLRRVFDAYEADDRERMRDEEEAER